MHIYTPILKLNVYFVKFYVISANTPLIQSSGRGIQIEVHFFLLCFRQHPCQQGMMVYAFSGSASGEGALSLAIKSSDDQGQIQICFYLLQSQQIMMLKQFLSCIFIFNFFVVSAIIPQTELKCEYGMQILKLHSMQISIMYIE